MCPAENNPSVVLCLVCGEGGTRGSADRDGVKFTCATMFWVCWGWHCGRDMGRGKIRRNKIPSPYRLPSLDEWRHNTDENTNRQMAEVVDVKTKQLVQSKKNFWFPVSRAGQGGRDWIGQSGGLVNGKHWQSHIDAVGGYPAWGDAGYDSKWKTEFESNNGVWSVYVCRDCFQARPSGTGRNVGR